ncbi:TlpA family protein disulfide reductase [Microbacterium sp.]|uniref:TlpA family protein disulfide reductase n=1 Tax=Microbacterium sp. TaxID=51671 RepID=UPI002811F426|nr:thioredoxin family protein [Microbacterium sp.]
MSPTAALAIVAALLLATIAVGVVWRLRDGRLRAGDGSRVDPADIPLSGSRATLVQFSTEICARCPHVRRMLSHLASALDGVEHIEVDLTHRPDLASRYHVLQTPTTFVLDRDGRVRSRFNGVPRRHDLVTALATIPATEERR